jgi:hypothetical protein
MTQFQILVFRAVRFYRIAITALITHTVQIALVLLMC